MTTREEFLATELGQRYLKFIDGHHTAWTDIGSGKSDTDPSSRRVDTPLERANVVGSRVLHDGRWLHRPLLDVDINAMLLPSSTAGHHHLYIDRLMEWDEYEKLLCALSRAGVCDAAHAALSIERRETWLRLPWVSK